MRPHAETQAVRLLAPLALALATFSCQNTKPPPPGCPLTAAPTPAPSAQLAPEASGVAALVERVRPAVVNITAVHETVSHSPEKGWPFGGLFGGGDRIVREKALGSGFIIDSEGHVATNSHVIEGAEMVQVKLLDGRVYRARVLGRDELTDLAVIRIEGAPPDLPVASLGSSSAIRVGDTVLAIGNPFGLGDTVTKGIVSAKGRALNVGTSTEFLQTDASINPGNSGGPLFDLQGQVVGINTAINPKARGIGFAIPIDEVKRFLPRLIATGHVTHGRLGVTVQEMDEPLALAVGLDHRPRGAILVELEPGGPGAKAGLRPGDVVLAINGKSVPAATALPPMIAALTPGSQVELTVLRDGVERPIEATLGATREEPGAEPEGATSRQGSQSGPEENPRSFGFGATSSPGGGAMVESIVPRGPADGELVPGDVIESVGHHAVSGAAELQTLLRAVPGRQAVLLRVRREGQARYVGLER